MSYGNGSRSISENVDSIASSQESATRAAWAGVMLQGMNFAQANRHHNEALGELHHTQDQIDESIGELRNIQDQIEHGQRLADQRSAQLIATMEKSEDNQGYRDYAMWVGSTPEGKLYEYTYRPEAKKRIRFIAALNEFWQREVSIAFATAVNRLSKEEQALLLHGKPIYRDTEERTLPSPPNQDEEDDSNGVRFFLYCILFFIIYNFIFGFFELGWILKTILSLFLCFCVGVYREAAKEKEMQEYNDMLEQESARLKHIDELNVAKLNELINQLSSELGFDISKIEEVKNGWNSNSAVARATSVAEFMGDVHVTLPMARQ